MSYGPSVAHVCSLDNLKRNMESVESKIRLGHTTKMKEIDKRLAEIERMKMLKQTQHTLDMIEFISAEIMMIERIKL
jgi:hypothetical protein